MNKVWITRSLPGALLSGQRLSDMGFDPLIYPLLKIIPPKRPLPGLPRGAFLLVTSQNGLRALAGATANRHYPVITVGDATAKLAQEMGFADVVSAGGNAEDLSALIRQNYAGETRPFIHISGDVIRRDVAGELRAAGLSARRHIYYQSQPVSEPPDADLSQLAYVFLYSPRGAEAFLKLSVDIGHAAIISISRETDAVLGEETAAPRLIAERPTENSMLSLLD